MIETIREQIAALPISLAQIADRIFDIGVAKGYVVPSANMEPWIAQHFGSVDAVRAQTVVTITNRFTGESALYNPLRALRPALASGDDIALEAWIARELAENDTFSDPERDTPADLFGRIRGRACITASNIAKYAGWHGLVIFDQPHPLRFGSAEIVDYLTTALRWIAAAHAYEPHARYPLITWNCLPKSGATQMHGHMQIALVRDAHYTHIEHWRRAALSYRTANGTDYFNDLFTLHQALGLAIPHATLRIFATLTPVRDHEIVMLADLAGSFDDLQSGRSGQAEAIARALAAILRQLIDTHGMRAFNLVCALPPLGPPQADWVDMPLIVRIADRGAPMTSRNDMGAMELFAAPVITVDPFVLMARWR